jgi:hypothetical protein
MKLTLNFPSKLDQVEFYSAETGSFLMISEEKYTNFLFHFDIIDENKIKLTYISFDGGTLIEIDEYVELFKTYFEAILKLHSDAIFKIWHDQFDELDETTYEETVSPQCR